MGMTTRLHLIGLSALCTLATPALVAAQAAPLTQYVTQDKAPEKPSQDGFKGSITLGGSLNVTHNRYMVGQVEGRSVLLGLSTVGAGLYRSGKHEWRGNLNLAEAWARTPAVDVFVKSNDLLQIQNLYNYFVNDWTGPFLRLELGTPILKTQVVSDAPTTYADVADPTDTTTTRRFALADAFQPLTINESAGWFAQPIAKEAITLYSRAGFGGRHTFADGAKIITDDGATPNVEFTRLADVHQGGLELFTGLEGKLQEGRLQYAFGVGVLFPFINNDAADRSVGELTRVAGQATVGIGIFDWMSLNYLLQVIRDRQLVDEVQVQNSLLLTVSYSASTPEEAPPVDPAIQALEEKVAAAEARAVAAEQRAAAAEAQIQAEPPAPANIPAPAPAPAPAEPAPAPAPAPATP
jgi:hypothetical protein